MPNSAAKHEVRSLERLVRVVSLIAADAPKKLFDLRNLVTLSVVDCRMIKALHARGVAKSKLETLICQDCIGLVELPSTLGNNLVNLQTLDLTGCTNLGRLPPWVGQMEKSGVAVQRPRHLE